MNFGPKVREWVKAEYFELRGRGDFDVADIETLLKSPEVKKLWTLLGGLQLTEQHLQLSSSKLLHLSRAIAVARKGIPPEERISRSARVPAAAKLGRAAESLARAWRELKQLNDGNLPEAFIESNHEAAKLAAAEFESNFSRYNPPDALAGSIPRLLYAQLAVASAYTDFDGLLDAISDAAKRWPELQLMAPKPGDANAERLYFFRKVASVLREQYAAETMRHAAFEVMASFYGCDSLVVSNIDEFPPKPLTRAAPPRRR